MQRSQPITERPEGWSSEERFLWVAVGSIAVLAAMFSIAGLILPRQSSRGTASQPDVAGVPNTTPRTIRVELADISVKPNRIAVDAGTDVTLVVHNGGAIAHDLKVEGTRGTKMLATGKIQQLKLGQVTEEVVLWCTVPGHKDAGMKVTISVRTTTASATGSNPASNPASNPSASATTDKATAEQNGADNAAIDFSAAPSKDWMPYDPNLKPADGGKEHKVTFHATEKVIEVAPGVNQEMWTFNDVVPGPTLRGKVGDLFTITLVNDGKIEHSIDFHASKVAWNDEMRSIKPGESLVYQYIAKFAGIFMYHCGTAPALHHIGNGMFGAVIIDPPVLAPVDHEYILVQSELYTGPMGQPGSLAKMTSENFDLVVFNGYVSQYKFRPIRVEPNERVRVWVLDAGPSENSAFHIVGTIFDTVFREGAYVLVPDSRQGGSQVLDLQPAQGGFVEMTFDEAGLYPIVTHKFANVGKGALGLFQAGEVKGVVAGGH